MQVSNLVGSCVEVIARELLAGATDLQDDGLNVQRLLLDTIALLPLSVGQRLAACMQSHARNQQIRRVPQDDEDDLRECTPSEQFLWTSLVDRQWITDLWMAAVPHQFLAAPVSEGWSQLPLQLLDCSCLQSRVRSAPAAALVRETLSLEGLLTLNLSGWDDHVTDGLLETLASSCQQLQDVDISYCSKITDRALCTLINANTATLRRLSVNGLRYLAGEISIIVIEKCARLRTLELDDCGSLTRLPDVAVWLPHLTALHFQGLTQFADAQLTTALASVFPRLRCLRLGETKLSGVSLRNLLSDCARISLQEVNLSWCSRIDSAAIAELVRRSPALRVLKLRCTHADDSALELLGSRSASLVVLDLERCDNLTPSGFDTLVGFTQRSSACFLSLEKINLSWTSVSAQALSHLLTQCAETIRQIRVQGCKHLDSRLVDAMLACGSHWPRLRLLDCSWINDIADDTLQTLRDALPNAVVVGYYGMDE